MRKQSPETQLRHAKGDIRNLKLTVEWLRRELSQRKQCGQMMSNICFNLAQNEAYDTQHRQSMRDCREMWDKIVSVK